MWSDDESNTLTITLCRKALQNLGIILLLYYYVITPVWIDVIGAFWQVKKRELYGIPVFP